jgi:hypothetical protein
MERHLLNIRFVLAFDRPVGPVYTRAEGARSDTNAGPVQLGEPFKLGNGLTGLGNGLTGTYSGLYPVFLSSWGHQFKPHILSLAKDYRPYLKRTPIMSVHVGRRCGVVTERVDWTVQISE